MSESNTPILNLNAEQLAEMTRLKNAAQYPAMYLYLKTQVDVAVQSEPPTSTRHEELSTLSNWLDNAAAINADDGSFKSQFVRGAVDTYSRLENGTGISNERFQEVSDQLARDVYAHIIDKQGVLSAKAIINEDVQQAVEGLNLNDKWGWAGTLADLLPTWLSGLGGDMVQVDTSLPMLSYLAELSEVVAANIAGGAYAATTSTAYSIGEQFIKILSALTENTNFFLQADPATGLPWPTDTFDTLAADAAKAGAVAPPVNRDPLALDLDGDGLETIGTATSSRVLFDHNNDGVKTGTGWLKSDDAWLALDRNGNGTIDSGRELFGVDTIKSNGKLASSGFDALRDSDTNADGVIDASDSVFANLKIWRDLNQDGISQADELSSLADQHITSINLNATTGTKNLGNGNTQSAWSTFTRSNGEASGTIANLDLVNDTFYSQFTNPVELTEQAKAGFNLRGAGQVRDLAEAVSLSGTLGELVQNYSQQTTRQGQVDLLDSFLMQWANTSAMKSLKGQAEALAGQGVSLSYSLVGLTAGSAEYNSFINKLGVVERFMGFTYGGANGEARFTDLTATSGSMGVRLTAPQIANISLAYDRLKTNVYETLLLPTRLSSYVQFGIDIQDEQVVLDFAPMEQAFNTAIANNPRDGVVDLIEFISSVGVSNFQTLNWNALGFLSKQVNAMGDEYSTFFENLNGGVIGLKGAITDNITATTSNDFIVGSNGNETLSGSDGDDILFGRNGADSLYGGNGNDTLDGGAGNDALYGQWGNNTYLFGRGDGQDVIQSLNDTTVGKLNTLQFKAGVAVGDVVLKQVTDSEGQLALEISIVGTTDKITINSFLRGSDTSNTYNPIQQIKFDDGTTWDLNTIIANAFPGTAAADTQTGTADNNIMAGLAGADSLFGRNGNDTMSGGADNDTLWGEAGNDTLSGDTGNDTLYGGADNDTLDGGAGIDTLRGETGNNTYLFGRGDGQDIIWSYSDTTVGKLNTLQFKAGVAVADVVLKQVYDSESQLALEIGIAGTTDKITINSFFRGENPSNQYNPIQQIKFDDGTTWDLNTIIANAFPGTAAADTQTGTADNNIMAGLAGADSLFGRNGNDTMSGGADNDTLWGEAGNDTLSGDTGNDTLYGGADNDTLDGGAGSDSLRGETGNDTYLFGNGSGVDTLYESDATVGNADVLSIGAGISENQLWFRRVNADLEVSIIGTTDKTTISNWYSGNAYHVEQFKTADNKALFESQVDNLVSAMAAFAPPAAGQTTLPQNYQDALNAVIATNWK